MLARWFKLYKYRLRIQIVLWVWKVIFNKLSLHTWILCVKSLEVSLLFRDQGKRRLLARKAKRKEKKGKDSIHEKDKNVYSYWIFITNRNTSLSQRSTRHYIADRYKSCLHPKAAEAIELSISRLGRPAKRGHMSWIPLEHLPRFPGGSTIKLEYNENPTNCTRLHKWLATLEARESLLDWLPIAS